MLKLRPNFTYTKKSIQKNQYKTTIKKKMNKGSIHIKRCTNGFTT